MSTPSFSSKELRQLIISHQHETNHTPEWYSHPKHIFVYTWTGKPLFTRYGDDNKLVEIIGTISAFMTNFSDMLNNPLVSFQSGAYTFVILNKEPLFLFCVTRTQETVSQIMIQLSLLYYQLLSILTYNVINVLRDDPGYDPRELLGGTDLLTHSLLTEYDNNLPLLTQTLPTMRIHKATRVKLSYTLKKFKPKETAILFSFLLVNGKIVSLIKNKPIVDNNNNINTTSNHLFNYDLSILINMVHNQPSLRTSESLTPICLPFSNQDELVYVYSKFLPITISKKDNDKMFELLRTAKSETERSIYPYNHQNLQGITSLPLANGDDIVLQPNQHPSSIPIETFTMSSDVCLVTVSNHPMLFPRCQQHANQIVQYLESHYGEVRNSDYIAALISNSLTKIPSVLSPPQDGNNTSTVNQPMLTAPTNINNPSFTQQQSSLGIMAAPKLTSTSSSSSLVQSPSYLSHRLELQSIQFDSYLLHNIKTKCFQQITSYLESNYTSASKSTIPLLHELHYASLSTSNSMVYPWEVDIYDPKAPPPYITPNPPVNSSSSPNLPPQPPQQQAHLHSDLAHFVYIDIKTGSMLSSEALAPYRHLTTSGISIQSQSTTPITLMDQPPVSILPPLSNKPSLMAKSTTSSPEEIPTTKLSINVPASPTLGSNSLTQHSSNRSVSNNIPSHLPVLVRSKYIDNNPISPTPFNIGGHGVVCVTTTDTNGLYPEHNPQSIIQRSTLEPKLIPNHDFTRIPIAPCVTAVNTLSSHISLTDRYKQLHAKTHVAVNPKFSTQTTIDKFLQSTNSDQYFEPVESFSVLPMVKPSTITGLTTLDIFSHKMISKKPYLNSQQNPFPTLSQQRSALTSGECAISQVKEPMVFNYWECHDAIIVYQAKPGLYELYCTFPPLTSKESISNTLHRLVIAIQKDYDTYFARVTNV